MVNEARSYYSSFDDNEVQKHCSFALTLYIYGGLYYVQNYDIEHAAR